MTQFARPISDVTTGWATVPLWSKIDEAAADDADFITGTGNAKTFEVMLSAVTDPAVGTGHVVTLRARATGSSTAERLNPWGLYQGAVAIATLNSTITRSTFNNYTITLTEAQANAITNYADLRIRAVTSQGASETINVSWAQLAVPDAVVVHNLTAAGITTAAPTLDQVAIGQVHALQSGGIATAAPALDSPGFGQVHVMAAGGIVTAAPVVDSPAIGQAHALSASEIVAGPPTLSAPVLEVAEAPTTTLWKWRLYLFIRAADATNANKNALAAIYVDNGSGETLENETKMFDGVSRFSLTGSEPATVYGLNLTGHTSMKNAFIALVSGLTAPAWAVVANTTLTNYADGECAAISANLPQGAIGQVVTWEQAKGYMFSQFGLIEIVPADPFAAAVPTARIFSRDVPMFTTRFGAAIYNALAPVGRTIRDTLARVRS